MEEEYKIKLEQGLSRLGKLERDYLQSWASGSRTEYEERIKQYISSKLWAKAATAIGILSIIGGAGFLGFIDYTVNRIVDDRVKSEVKEKFSEKADGIILDIEKKYGVEYNNLIKSYEDANNDLTKETAWRRYHDTGHLLRKYLDVFIKLGGLDKSIINKELIPIFYKDAIQQFHKASENIKNNSRTHWELGKLFYEVTLSLADYGIVPDFDESIKHYAIAVENYPKDEIAKGWRASAYYDLSKVYLGKSKWLKDEGGSSEKEQKEFFDSAMKYMKMALSEFRTIDRKDVPWVTEAIVKIEDRIKLIASE